MRSFIASFSVLCISWVNAQVPATTAIYFSTANGLANNDVQHIIQDSRGFIWIGTTEGLSRYDGTRFKNYFAEKNDPTSLPANHVSYLHEYKTGHLLFLSAGSLVCLNTYTEQFYKPPSFVNKVIWAIRRMNDTHFTIETKDTCFIIDNNLKITEVIAPSFKQGNRIVTAMELSDTSMFVTNDLEFAIYNPVSKKYTSITLKIDLTDLKPEQQYFHPWYYDPKNQWLYMGNYWDGLHRISLTGQELYYWPSNMPGSILRSGGITFVKPKNDSLLWLGTNGFGMYQINIRNNVITELLNERTPGIHLTDNRVFDNCTDKDNNDWIATRKGVIKLNAPSKIIKSWQNEFIVNNNQCTPLNIVKGIDNHLYLSIYNGDFFYKINQQQNKITPFYKSPVPPIWCMNNFGDDLIFAGWSTRITQFNTLTQQFFQSDLLKKYFPASELVILAFKDSKGDKWYSANNNGGFVRIDAKNGSIHVYKKDGPNGNFTHGYYANYAEDKNGNLWFGVNKSGKLVEWIRATDRFREVALDTVNGTRNSYFAGITELIVDKANNLWAAFDGSGLVKYNIAENRSVHYSIQNGLPTNYVNSLKFDNKNRLWIGSLKGLSCLIVDENKFVSFTKEDGLPDDYFSESCSYYDSSTNKLWIGSSNSLISFDPDQLLRLNKKSLPIYIDEILVNSKKYTGDKLNNINFRFSNNNLQFSFIAVDLINGKNIEYSYQLSGVDDDWVYNHNNNTASYARLNPGNYTFSVRVKHKGDNEWITMNKPLSFTIQTPWFKTNWFRLLAILFILFVAWFIIRSYYLQKLHKQKIELEKKQAIEQERTRIATDMHDDFGASLSRIKFISEKMQISKYGDEHLKNDLTKISTYSDEMAEKMNEIVWALNQRYDSLEDLISFSRAYAADYLQNHNIHLLFKENNIPNKELNGEVRRNIFMVIKESLHNIVKHAAATEVSIEFIHNEHLHIIIKDNGRGFAEENIRPFANGLENMKKRMRDIGGNFTVKSEKGTIIEANIDI